MLVVNGSRILPYFSEFLIFLTSLIIPWHTAMIARQKMPMPKSFNNCMGELSIE
jgi:hypothetical protein